MKDNYLRLNNVGDGDYILTVKSTDSQGLESKTYYVLKFSISPPFWRTWWFNSIIMVLTALVIYSIFRYRELQRIKLEKFRLKVARDLHDDMGSHLSYIKILSEMEQLRSNSNPAFQNITTKVGEVMQTMSEIVWSINPINDTLIKIVSKIQEFAIDTLEPLGIHLAFDLVDIPDNIKFSNEDGRHFYLIFKEAINNIAKYSKAKNVTLKLVLLRSMLTCSLEDDGVGFNPMLISKGNGLVNMENRAKLLGAQFVIHTSPGGTEIKIIMKY